MNANKNTNNKDKLLFLIYFTLSGLLTWWFIIVCPLYISQEQMLLSTSIAGAKWSIQIILGLLFLKEKAWPFVKNIGFVCFIGSCILIPYIILSITGISNSGSFFLGSLIVAVIIMVFSYLRILKKLLLPIKWWIYWLICLAIAISLQLTVVFHVI